MAYITQIPPLIAESEQLSCRPRQEGRRDLRMRDIMNCEMITVTSDDTVFSAVKKMSDNSISCVIVVDDEMVIGILTDKDVLKGVAGSNVEFHRLCVGDRMSSPVEVVSPDTPVIAAGKTMEVKGIKRLPVVDAGRLVGIATQTDITRGLISISPLKAVSQIMSTDVVTVNTGASVAEAAQIMTSRGVSCLVATHHKGAAGIVTEKDVLRRVVALRRDPAQTQVVDIMSFPMISIPLDCSVLSAGIKMDQMHLHRLTVMVDNEVSGIVTQTDIAVAVRAELARLQTEQIAMTGQLRDIVRYIMQDMENLQTFLNGMPQVAQMADWASHLGQFSDNNPQVSATTPSQPS